MYNDIKNFLRLFKRSFGEYKTEIFFLIVLSFTSGILEGVGINAVIPLFAFINHDAVKGTDIISKTIESFFSYLHLSYTLTSLLIFIVALFVIKAVALFFADYVGTHAKVAYEKKTRDELFSLTARADWPYLSRQKVGYLDQTLINDISQGSSLLAYVSTSIILFANLAAYSLLVVNISWVVALFTSLFGGAVLLFLKPLFNKNMGVSKEMEGLYKELAHYINENIFGMKTVKAASVEEKIIEKSNKYFERMRILNLRLVTLRNATTALLQPAGLIVVIAIFAFFYKMTVFNFASFAVIVYAINKVFSYIQQIQSNLYVINAQVPYLVSIAKYKDEVKKHAEIDSGIKNFKFKDSLEFRNISFAYRSDNGVLSGVNFVIKRGEMVGLIGPSGAGKTTIVDLILRFFMPQRGDIFLDNEDIFDISMSEWRKNIGYVSQDLFLLNDTVENNIKFYSNDVTKDDMAYAAKMANIYDFIESLPNKFDTVVGERGILLSGGQRQRIVLARILARHPQLLILDEATSALDNESEILIQKAIESLRGKVTVLAIAHRLSTVKASDKLIVLDGGKIIEEGPPEELLKNKNSYFFKVYNLRI